MVGVTGFEHLVNSILATLFKIEILNNFFCNTYFLQQFYQPLRPERSTLPCRATQQINIKIIYYGFRLYARLLYQQESYEEILS